MSHTLATLNASIAQIIISTSDISPRHSLDNHPALINGITTLSKTFDEFVKEIHRVEANFLVDRTHRFCSIFDDLLSSIEKFVKNERDLTSKQNIPQLCSRLGEINEEILRQIDPKFDTTVDYREKLLVVGKSVANTTAVYVLKGKEIAGNINEPTLINEIISRATQCALATSQLVACTKVICRKTKRTNEKIFFSDRCSDHFQSVVSRTTDRIDSKRHTFDRISSSNLLFVVEHRRTFSKRFNKRCTNSSTEFERIFTSN